MQAIICDSCGNIIDRDKEGYTELNLHYNPQRRLNVDSLAKNDRPMDCDRKEPHYTLPMMHNYGGMAKVNSVSSGRKNDIAGIIHRSVPDILKDQPRGFMHVCYSCLSDPIKLSEAISKYKRKIEEYEHISEDFAQQIRVEIKSF